MLPSIPSRLPFEHADVPYRFQYKSVAASQPVVAEFQHQLTTLTTAFLNSAFRRRPLIRDWSYCQLLGDLLVTTQSPVRFSTNSDLASTAENLAKAYRLLQASVATTTAGQSCQCLFGADHWSLPEKAPELKARLSRIEQRLSDLLAEGHASGLLLHGSMGSLDFNAYSDIDILCVISAAAACDPSSLLAIRNVLGNVCRDVFSYDELQHHGVFVTSQIDLDYYSEALLPLEAIRAGSLICGDGGLSFRVRDSRFDAIRSYLGTTQVLEAWSSGKYRLANRDLLKRFNSNLLLLPSLYLETRGLYPYKRESFQLIAKLLSDAALQSIAVASQVRASWSRDRWPSKLERAVVRRTQIPQYLIRAGFARTLDHLQLAELRTHYKPDFWTSLAQLFREMGSTFGLPLPDIAVRS